MNNRLIINVLLLILTILEFQKIYLTPEIHEIIGIMLIILLMIHLKQNIYYFHSITKTKDKKLLLITNILLLITFALTIITGLLSSQMIPYINIHQMTTNYLHKILAYITILLISIHLGLNTNKTITSINNKIKNTYLKRAIAIILIILGFISFIEVDFLNHLTGNLGFSSYNINIIVNSLEYISIITAIVIITYYLTTSKKTT